MSTQTTQSLEQLINLSTVKSKVKTIVMADLRKSHGLGLVTTAEWARLVNFCSLDSKYLFRYFSKMADRPFRGISDDDMYDFLKSGAFSWVDLAEMDAIAWDNAMHEVEQDNSMPEWGNPVYRLGVIDPLES